MSCGSRPPESNSPICAISGRSVPHADDPACCVEIVLGRVEKAAIWRKCAVSVEMAVGASAEFVGAAVPSRRKAIAKVPGRRANTTHSPVPGRCTRSWPRPGRVTRWPSPQPSHRQRPRKIPSGRGTPPRTGAGGRVARPRVCGANAATRRRLQSFADQSPSSALNPMERPASWARCAAPVSNAFFRGKPTRMS